MYYAPQRPLSTYWPARASPPMYPAASYSGSYYDCAPPLPAALLDLRILTYSCIGPKRGASPRDAHGADIPPVRAADGAAADDLPQPAGLLPPPHAAAGAAGVLHELLSGSVL
ncbi:hypothetical protein VTO73DRAFT_15547 [Trametes versicolor]